MLLLCACCGFASRPTACDSEIPSQVKPGIQTAKDLFSALNITHDLKTGERLPDELCQAVFSTPAKDLSTRRRRTLLKVLHIFAENTLHCFGSTVEDTAFLLLEVVKGKGKGAATSLLREGVAELAIVKDAFDSWNAARGHPDEQRQILSLLVEDFDKEDLDSLSDSTVSSDVYASHHCPLLTCTMQLA